MINRTKHDLIINKTDYTSGRGNRETNLLSIINPSLVIVYCSTTLSNHSLIGIKFHPDVVE
jgi:hypothetical protein